MHPFLLLIDGPKGSGKTAAAEILHQRFPRTALLGMDRIKWSMSDFKRNRRNNTIIYDVVKAMAGAFLDQGVNVIVEQGFREGLANEFLVIGKKHKARMFIVSLTAPRSVLLVRVKRRMKTRQATSRPPIAWSRVQRNMRIQAARPPLGGPVIDTEHITPVQVANIINQIITGKPHAK